MAERRYDLGQTRMGSTRVETSFVASDEGHTIETKFGQQMHHDVVKAVTGTAHIDPTKMKSRRDHIWCKVVPVPLGHSSILELPGTAKYMMRHRAVTLEGLVILFKQGRGALVRLGDNEEEWISLPLKHIMGYDYGEKRIHVTNGYVLITPIEIPQESSSILSLQPAHTRAKMWAAGKVELQGSRPTAKHEIIEGERVVYDTTELTEVMIMGEIVHMVHINHVWGVLT